MQSFGFSYSTSPHRQVRPLYSSREIRKRTRWLEMWRQTIGPRPELVQEMLAKGKHPVLICNSPSQFLEHATRSLGLNASAKRCLKPSRSLRQFNRRRKRA